MLSLANVTSREEFYNWVKRHLDTTTYAEYLAERKIDRVAAEAVYVCGVIVRNASFHNMDRIVKKDIRIGDPVVVERAGDVIPYIVKAVPGKRDGTERLFTMPGVCRVCKPGRYRRW